MEKALIFPYALVIMEEEISVEEKISMEEKIPMVLLNYPCARLLLTRWRTAHWPFTA